MNITSGNETESKLNRYGEPDIPEIEGSADDQNISQPSAPFSTSLTRGPGYDTFDSTQSNTINIKKETSKRKESMDLGDACCCTYNADNSCRTVGKRMSNVFCNPVSYIVYLILAGHFIILMSIWFVPITNNLNDRKFYTDSTCESIGLHRVTNRCCSVESCNCQQCNLMSSSCDNLVNQPLNRSTCCSTSCCAATCCSATCCHTSCSNSVNNMTIYRGIDEINKYQSKPIDVDGCTMICICCGHTCCSTVSQKTCSFTCGTCFQYHLTFKLDFNQNLYETDMDCGQDDFPCDRSNIDRYGTGNTWKCWYDARDPSHIRFDGVPPVNKTAWGFFIFFCVTAGLTVIAWPIILIRRFA